MREAFPYLIAIVAILWFTWWSSTWNDPEPETWQERQGRIEREKELNELARRGYQQEISFHRRTREEQIEFMALQFRGEGMPPEQARMEAEAEFDDEIYFLQIMTDLGDPESRDTQP